MILTRRASAGTSPTSQGEIHHRGKSPGFLLPDTLDLELLINHLAAFLRVKKDPSAQAAKRKHPPLHPSKPAKGWPGFFIREEFTKKGFGSHERAGLTRLFNGRICHTAAPWMHRAEK